MRGLNPKLEQAFFDIFRDYYDLERIPARPYTTREYSLERMRPLAELAGDPQNALRVIHIAGTKGKGSTCYLLGALLKAAARRCGTFTSPHLATVRERFQIDGDLVDYDTLLAESRTYEKALRQAGLTPSLFEIMTILSLRLFVRAGCEFAILETGIGGLLDSTNFVPRPDCCAITAVSLDHTQLLGTTIAEIAAQKAGIIKPGIPVVCGRQPYPEATVIIRNRAAELGAPCLDPVPAAELGLWRNANWPPFLVENLGTAMAVCRYLRIAPDARRFVRPELRARCEQVSTAPLVILDGAHNADSARRLVESLQLLYPGKAFTVVLGMVKGKDVRGTFEALTTLSRDFVLTHPRSQKGSELEALAALAREMDVTAKLQPDITQVSDLPRQRNLVFTGSFFTALIGEALFSRDETGPPRA